MLTFSRGQRHGIFDTAVAAGISRLYGGYHIAADNVEGLVMGRRVTDYIWPTITSYFDGTADVEDAMDTPE